MSEKCSLCGEIVDDLEYDTEVGLICYDCSIEYAEDRCNFCGERLDDSGYATKDGMLCFDCFTEQDVEKK